MIDYNSEKDADEVIVSKIVKQQRFWRHYSYLPIRTTNINCFNWSWFWSIHKINIGICFDDMKSISTPVYDFLKSLNDNDWCFHNILVDAFYCYNNFYIQFNPKTHKMYGSSRDEIQIQFRHYKDLVAFKLVSGN